MDDLPMPDPAFQLDAIPGVQGEQYAYTADQMRAYAAAAVAAERERCAKICEDHAADRSPPYKAHEDTYLDGWLDASNECGWAIRARAASQP